MLSVIHSYLELTELEPLISFFTLNSQAAPLYCLFVVVVLPQVTWKELALARIYRPGHHWCRMAPTAIILTQEEGKVMSLKGAMWAQCIPSLQGCLGLATSTSQQWGLGFAEQYVRNFDTYSRKKWQITPWGRRETAPGTNLSCFVLPFSCNFILKLLKSP